MAKARQVGFRKIRKLFAAPAADVEAVHQRFFGAGHGVGCGARNPLQAVQHVGRPYPVELKSADRRVKAAAMASGSHGDSVRQLRDDAVPLQGSKKRYIAALMVQQVRDHAEQVKLTCSSVEMKYKAKSQAVDHCLIPRDPRSCLEVSRLKNSYQP
jgi:hypothetical protein